MKRDHGYKLLSAAVRQVTGAGETTTRSKPSSGELDPISAELEYKQHQPSYWVSSQNALWETYNLWLHDSSCAQVTDSK